MVWEERAHCGDGKSAREFGERAAQAEGWERKCIDEKCDCTARCDAVRGKDAVLYGGGGLYIRQPAWWWSQSKGVEWEWYRRSAIEVFKDEEHEV